MPESLSRKPETSERKKLLNVDVIVVGRRDSVTVTMLVAAG